MKSILPITILITTCFLVACEGGVKLVTTDATFTQTEANVRNRPADWFEEAETLATTGLSEEDYMEQVASLLTSYVAITNDEGFPTGLNYEITNKLLGDNSVKIAVIDANHPRINEKGEIVDSWDTPYYFHSETSNDISIQSAGPDLLQYTHDDIVYEELNVLAGSVQTAFSTDNPDGAPELDAALTEPEPSTFDTYEDGGVLAN